MRVCLAGNFVPQADEAVRRLASHLAGQLARRHQVLELNLREWHRWGRVRGFHPDILHFVLSPTFGGLLAARALSWLCPGGRTVLSAPQPAVLWGKGLLPWLKPDLVVTQSQDGEDAFRRRGCRTAFLPHGVETERFTPRTAAEKETLRDKYGLPRQGFIVLHVGPLREGRNLRPLMRLREMGCQVLILGRPSQPAEGRLLRDLREGGCLIWQDYQERLEEVYALADCYLFPTLNPRNSIDLPLSVLEAMSCNLPVVTTPFGALPRLFSPGDGLWFVGGEAEMLAAVRQVKMADGAVKNRERVLPYSWERVAESLEALYQGLGQ